MRKLKVVFIFSIIVSVLILLIFGFLIFKSELGKSEEKEKTAEQSEKRDTELSAEDIINRFAETIFTYDTSERAFYEGADRYMTKKAYDEIVPLSVEPLEEAPIHMVSRLEKITCYFRQNESDCMEAMVEVWYRLSGTGEFRIRQILKLSVVQQNGWKISSCTILDTMEE